MNDERDPQWRHALDCDNGTCIEVAHTDDAYLIRESTNPDGPVLRFTPDEWAAFVRGVRDGDFDFG